MKHLIVSGCSFTSIVKPNIEVAADASVYGKPKEMWTWVEWIKYYESEKYKVYNYGCPTNDNDTIVESTLYSVNKLLKEGVKAEDIEIIIQWTAVSRKSFFIPRGMVDRNKIKTTYHINDFITEKNYKYQYGFKYLSGGYNKTNNLEELNDICFNYLDKEYSNEERIINYLKNIIFISNFCKSYGIKYKFFTMRNNFSSDAFQAYDGVNKNNKKQQEVQLQVRPDLIEKKLIGYNWNTGIFMDNPYINYLINLIDLNDFWFYEVEKYHKYGGAMEWCISEWDDSIDDDSKLNLSKIIYFEMEELSEDDRKNYFYKKAYGHPSAFMWRRFYFDVIKKYFL